MQSGIRGRHCQDFLTVTKGGPAFMRDIGTRIPISLCHTEPPPDFKQPALPTNNEILNLAKELIIINQKQGF